VNPLLAASAHTRGDKGIIGVLLAIFVAAQAETTAPLLLCPGHLTDGGENSKITVDTVFFRRRDLPRRSTLWLAACLLRARAHAAAATCTRDP